MAENTRARLLKSAQTLFASGGYHNTTVGEIEKRAGLTARAGGFYRHFKSKEALLLAMAEARLETPDKLGMTRVFPLGDTRAELIYLARAYEQLNQDADGITDVIRAEAYRIAELSRLIREANDHLFQALIDWVGTKPAFRRKSRAVLGEVTMMIFGGWLFYLSRRGESGDLPIIQSGSLLRRWSEFWSQVLDEKKARI